MDGRLGTASDLSGLKTLRGMVEGVLRGWKSFPLQEPELERSRGSVDDGHGVVQKFVVCILDSKFLQNLKKMTAR